MTGRGLSRVSLPDLARLRRLLHDGTLTAPLQPEALLSVGLGHAWRELEWLAALDGGALAAVLEVTVAERASRKAPTIELVWTGPEARASVARDTAVVLRELFERAERRVLVAGYSFWDAADILAPLHRAIAERGVEAWLFLHVEEERFRAGDPAETAARAADAFLAESWPFGPPHPALFYDPRTAAPASRVSLHAKCVTVDEHWALVGSANFTDRAHTRNIEVGALIEDAAFAAALFAQWHGLVECGLARRTKAAPA